MGELSVSNGRTRSPMSRGKDYVTAEAVQAAVNTLLQNDKSLSENQKTLHGEAQTTRSRVADLEYELARLRGDLAAIRGRADVLEAQRLGARFARLWRMSTALLMRRAD